MFFLSFNDRIIEIIRVLYHHFSLKLFGENRSVKSTIFIIQHKINKSNTKASTH